MKRYVLTFNNIEGYHYYPNAPEFCSYLAQRHRHIFVIKCEFHISHNDREIEINFQQQEIENFLKERFGYPCEFGGRSCEHIAELLLNNFDKMYKCSVLEDNYGGASLTR